MIRGSDDPMTHHYPVARLMRERSYSCDEMADMTKSDAAYDDDDYEDDDDDEDGEDFVVVQ